MSEGRLFAIKRFALHDGPGIRTTVFLKGCPLRCLWCHNPEGLSYKRELAFYPHLCIACDGCYAACVSGALTKETSPIEDYNKDECTLCGRCAEACPAGAIEMIGRDAGADEVVAEVARDKEFYDRSGGGMTVSGGEPLAQPDFTAELLSKAKALGIHTVLDTCGLAPYEVLDTCLEFTDHLYFDIKVVDDEKHCRLIGISNGLILENLRRAGASRKPLTLRIPLVKGLNDSPEDISGLTDLIACLPVLADLHRVEIIPYHRIGEGKYKSLGLEYELKSQELHSDDELRSLVRSFQERGLSVYCSQLVPPSLGGTQKQASGEEQA
jgi:pyruvate formate lyase activating enzyme